MSPSIAVTDEQVKASEAWVYEFYKYFDSFDLDKWFTKFYKPDAVLNLCNNPSMKGYDEIRAHFQKEQPLLTSMKHTMKHIDVLPDRIYVQNEATFIVKADPKQKEIKFKAVCLFWKNIDEDKLSSVDVYFDPTPLIERIKMFL
jgi:ketosteroid isomerase-like protein